MKRTAETVTTVDLGYEQLFVFDGGREARVRVLYGATWLTEEGQPGDAIVGVGREVALHGGRAVAEGLGPTRLQIVQSHPDGTLQRAAHWLQRASRNLREQAGRLQLGSSTAETSA